MLAEEKNWSLDRAAGYRDGERYRKSGQELSAYLNVGIDEYARGFRAAYYERDEPVHPRRSVVYSAPPIPQRHRMTVTSKKMPGDVSGTSGSRLLHADHFRSGKRSADISK